MLPRDLLGVSEHGGDVVPAYVRRSDEPWLRALLDEYRRFAGAPRRALRERLCEPLPVAAPSAALARARHVLDGLSHTRVETAVPPRRIRAAVFRAAAVDGAPREEIVARVAAELDLPEDAIDRDLFADIGDERLVGALPRTLDAGDLALRVNLALVQGLLGRATAVTLRLRGNARDVVRHARLSGLLCTVTEVDAETYTLALSGPLSLFRRTLVYGRALGSIVPRLAWCDAWELHADCTFAEGLRKRVVVRDDAPILPAAPPRRFDSKLEQRFARDFAKLGTDWDLLREPRPVRCGEALVFPDFELVHRRQRDRRWLVEIVGFWTHDYLSRKLAQLRSIAGRGWIVCVDEARGCDARALPAHVHVVPFRRRIDAARVLAIVEARLL